MGNGTNIENQLGLSDYLLAFIFCIVFTIVCVVFSTQVIHWFIFPLIPCGVLIGADAIGWFRHKYDLFDPKGMLGLMGLHFFFTAPLLVVVWDVRVSAVASNLEDYRPWLGLLAILHCFGLMIYRWVESSVSNRPYNEASARVWIANDSRWSMVLTACFIIAVISQAYVIFGRGNVGVSWDLSIVAGRLAGGGVFRLLGGSGPIFLMILITLIRNRFAVKQSSLSTVYILLAFMFVVSLVSGGLVGSRGVTVWSLFWIAGIVHFFWRRFSVKQALIGMVVLVLFMNVYGFFKHLGTKGLDIFKTEGFVAASYESGITARGILIGDLSRAHVNAYMAYVLVEKPYSYAYKWGRTIWGDILVQFPRWIYRNYYNLVGAGGKQIAGTDIMMGPSEFNPSNPYSFSRYIYGLTGQVMLNFGLLPIPFAFIILGYCVGRFRRAMYNWKPYDMRLFIAPVIIQLLVMLLTHDFDNLLFAVIFSVALPLVIVRLISYRMPRHTIDQQQEEFTESEEPVQLSYE
jgi:hypothetical protein